MGIDIHARWKSMTEEEKEAQITGCSVLFGHVGYLHESYHGEPYATRFLVSEAFNKGKGPVPIPASVLVKRLPKTFQLVEKRARTLYSNLSEEEIQALKTSFLLFVSLCELKEQEKGEPVQIEASY